MVSGVVDPQQHPVKYKSNKKGGFFSTSSPQQAPPPPPISAVTAHHNNKRFSESDLRPWPPMYAARSQRYPTPDEASHHHNNNHLHAKHNNAQPHQQQQHHHTNNNFRSLSSPKQQSILGNGNGTVSSASAQHHHYKNNTHKSSASSTAGIYERNKYNFNMGKAQSIASSMSSNGDRANNNHNSNNSSSSQDYYMLSQPYVTNSLAPSEGSVYASRDSNLLMKERDKNRFRKLRNPTASSPSSPPTSSNAHHNHIGGGHTRSAPGGGAYAMRSKSMEDVRSEVIVSSSASPAINGATTTADWPTYIKDNFKNLNNGREVHQHHIPHRSSHQQHGFQHHGHHHGGGGGAHHHGGGGGGGALASAAKNSNMRRSMDNLLKVDTVSGGGSLSQHQPFMHHHHSPALPFGGGVNGSSRGFQVNAQNDPNRPRFVPVTALEDVQAVRCAEFHPNGRVYSVGSNSKTFRICEYPSLSDIREDHTTYQPTVLFKRTKHHKGSIYCMAWSPQGDLVATGSNDKTVKLMRYNELQQQLEGKETELTMHDGTVRDLCFLEDSTNKASLLISGGAGDCKVYVTDCATATPFQALSGHGGHILSLYNWGGAMFVSGSQDKTVRFWDLRTRGCVNTVTPATVPGSRQGSPVAAVCVDPSGRLLVSGHEDSSCVLYDIRGNRPTQCFKPHATDVRSIRFSPSAYYLLTAGYDNKLVLTDLQGDLTMPLPSVVVAQHSDKVISGRWHPTDFSFLSTSADKTATLWALPPI